MQQIIERQKEFTQKYIDESHRAEAKRRDEDCKRALFSDGKTASYYSSQGIDVSKLCSDDHFERY